jgi:hypothetical protein
MVNARKHLLGSVLGLLGMTCGLAANSAFPELGTAADFSVLGLGKPSADAIGGTGKVDLANTTVHGDIGIGPHGTLDFQGPATIEGDLYLDPLIKDILTNAGTVTGSIITTEDLSGPVADALGAAAYFAALTPTQVVASKVDSSMVIYGSGGMNVIDIPAIELDGVETLRLVGGPSDQFVLNIGGGFDLMNNAWISMVPPGGDLLINVTGEGTPITTSTGSVINGTLLGATRKFTLQGRSGPIIGGELDEVSLVSGTVVDTTPFPILSEPFDLSGDRTGDIILRNESSGRLYLWIMDGSDYVVNLIGNLDPVWQVVAVADFGGDGKGDLLFRNQTTGKIAMWEMNGPSYLSSNVGALDPIWEVQGAGDFGGDGKSDILLRHASSGLFYLWEMDGPMESVTRVGTLDPVWEVSGIGDFGGDGRADILLRHSSSGLVYIWEMDGASYTSSKVSPLDPAWVVKGIGDFNGDGKADVLLRHSGSGLVYQWQMDGASQTALKVGPLDPLWEVRQVSDFGSDGKSDILLRHSDTGLIYIWEMDAADFMSSRVGPLDLSWVVQPPEATAAPDPVVANDDTASTLSDASVIISVLGNDTPTGSVSVVPGSLTQPTHGEVTLNGDGTITYTQDGLALESEGMGYYKSNCQSCHAVRDFNGYDTFTYTSTDGVSSDTATVTVTVWSFDPTYTTGTDLSGATYLDACIDLPSISKHAGCLGLTDAQIEAIGRFVGEVFP